ncbi:MAG: MutS-related protein family 1 [Ferruginibacter sp.]|nr:MutS-related protein family 1 [Ferruginibacter sp.]
MPDPSEFYAANLEKLRAEKKRLQRRKSVFGMLRLGNIFALVIVFYFLYSFGWAYVAGASILLLILFTRLVHRDLSNRASLIHTSHLIRINENEGEALNGNYSTFPNGEKFQQKEHYYANDLDLFGQASLFQFLNRTCSDMGAATLASWLLAPSQPEVIVKRQQAVKELAGKIPWLQHLQAVGQESNIRQATLDRLNDWMESPSVFIQFKHWRWLRFFLPAIVLSCVGATIIGWMPLNSLYIILFLFAVIAFQLNKLIGPIHEQLSRMVDELDTLAQSIRMLENEQFNSALLQDMQSGFSSEGLPASKKIQQLKKLLDRLDIRYNIVISFPLNILLLWNLQQVLSLEQWKKQAEPDLQHWFAVLGEFEALNSFAVLHFNQPSWIFPELAPKHFYLEATELGHPLIAQKKRVNNFIRMEHNADLMLVTGSNMAGKSTYLRSVGIAVIMAMAGAPVCSRRFIVSPVLLLSSMRIADNLEESTSTFYAELKKLKTVIDKVNAGEKVFVLLDEILRGTNSLDRHTGSVALMKQLIHKNAAAIIATHDIALADLQQEFPNNIENYHFDVQVNNEELYFDYKLKPGVCTSMNASILMKKIGIEL